jgi:hypothetical protein
MENNEEERKQKTKGKSMSAIFGANWWTTLWGWITLAAGAIALKPEIIAFLPDAWEPTLSGIAGFITVIAGGVFAAGVKSRNVTGGNTAQTADGHVAKTPSTSVIEAESATPK